MSSGVVVRVATVVHGALQGRAVQGKSLPPVAGVVKFCHPGFVRARHLYVFPGVGALVAEHGVVREVLSPLVAPVDSWRVSRIEALRPGGALGPGVVCEGAIATAHHSCEGGGLVLPACVCFY